MLASLFGAVLCAAPLLQARAAEPVKVFVLLGQSNMLGEGHVGPASSPKSLEYAVKKDHLYPWLVDSSGNWVVNKNARFVHVMPGRGAGGMRVMHNQWFTVEGKHIGPEFGIGHEVLKTESGPVLLLKSCIGNRSIGWDLLPPGSKGYVYDGYQYAGYKQSPMKWKVGTTPKPIGWYAGKEYDMDLANAKAVLNNLSKYYPGHTQYKIVGFFFWQGDKDRYDKGLAAHYEQNLVNYIKAIRKDFNAPKAPFVLATLGQTAKGAGGTGGEILTAQMDVANPQKYPDFAGNVATVYSHPLSKGGASNSHYGGNAQTYMDIGLAMGKAMDQLLQNH